jgi:hypothetical protein
MGSFLEDVKAQPPDEGLIGGTARPSRDAAVSAGTYAMPMAADATQPSHATC